LLFLSFLLSPFIAAIINNTTIIKKIIIITALNIFDNVQNQLLSVASHLTTEPNTNKKLFNKDFSTIYIIMIHFSISKNELFTLIDKSFTDSIQLLEAVKKDFNRMSIIFNNIKQTNYIEFLEKIINIPNLLNFILLLCNQNAHFYYYNKLHTILSKYGYYIVQSSSNINDNLSLITNITINPFVKQVVLSNKYCVIEIDKNSDINVKKNMDVDMIVNLSCNDDILFRINLF
jgi:hypothetical protein